MTIVFSGFFARETAEALCEQASDSHALGYPTAAIFEDTENPQRWRLVIYFEKEIEVGLLARELGQEARFLEKATLPDETDWVSESLKDLTPVAVGRFFVHGSHDRDKVRPFHRAILIDANQAFGTGHHGTTAGCLEAIAAVTKRRSFHSILDLGTGSGVLAAALAMETRKPVLATDIDPVAIRVARENMALNNIAGLVACATATGFHHPLFRERGPFDLVVANILAGPLRTLARPMSLHLAENATIILSGLLIRQQSAVLSAYREQGARLVEAIHREGWATLILARP